jgi:hypothetical protein
VYTFALCARRFLAHAGKTPTDIKAADVESFLLDLTRKGRSPQTRNVNLSAVRCLLFATRLSASARAWWHQCRSDDLHRARNQDLAHCLVRHPLKSHRRPRSQAQRPDNDCIGA